MISRVATSPHLSWFDGFARTWQEDLVRDELEVLERRCRRRARSRARTCSASRYRGAFGSEWTLLIMIRSFVFGSFLGIATSSLSESPTTRQNFSSDSNHVSMKLRFSSVLNAFSNLAPASLGNDVRMRSRTKSTRGSGGAAASSSLPMAGSGASCLRLRARAGK